MWQESAKVKKIRLNFFPDMLWLVVTDNTFFAQDCWFEMKTSVDKESRLQGIKWSCYTSHNSQPVVNRFS